MKNTLNIFETFNTIFETINPISASNYHVTEITSPLDQFKIVSFLNIDLTVLNNIQISLTNIGLYLSTAVFIAVILTLLATNYNKIISNR